MKSFKWNRLAIAVATAAMVGVVPGARALIIDDVLYEFSPMVIVWATNSDGTKPGRVGDIFMLSTTAGQGPLGDFINGEHVYTVMTGSLDKMPDTPTGKYTQYGNIVDATNTATVHSAYGDTGGSGGYLDANDTYQAFDITIDSDIGTLASVKKSFYAASNVAFSVMMSSVVVNSGTLFDETNITLGMACKNTPGPALAGATNPEITFGGAATAQCLSANAAGGAITDTLDTFNALAKPVIDQTDKTALDNGTITEQSVRFDATYGFNYDLSLGAGTGSVTVTYTIYSL